MITAVFALPYFLFDGLLPLMPSHRGWLSDLSCSSLDNRLLKRFQFFDRRGGGIDGNDGSVIVIEKIFDVWALGFVLQIRDLILFLCAIRARITTVRIAIVALSGARV